MTDRIELKRQFISKCLGEIDKIEDALPSREIVRAAPGTPDRRRLDREARDAARTAWLLAYTPEKRLLVATLRKSIASAKRSIAAIKRSGTKKATLRRAAQSKLRALGFERQHSSGCSSYYSRYSHEFGYCEIRISDHKVPMTAERDFAVAHGGHSWATGKNSIIIGDYSSPSEISEAIELVLNGEN